MAIMNNIEMSEYKEIQEIIEEILLKRKYKFNVENIIMKIRKEVLNRGFDKKYVDCSFFDILVLNTIDKFVDDYDNAKFYKIDKFYFPVDYIIYEDYKVSSENRLLYYVSDNNSVDYFQDDRYFIDIESGDIVNLVRKSDFVLCGGISRDRYKTTLQSNVDYKEIMTLFKAFFEEGASREEAINHILNYYKAMSVSADHSWGKDFIINCKESSKNKEPEKFIKRQKVKSKRKKIIHK